MIRAILAVLVALHRPMHDQAHLRWVAARYAIPAPVFEGIAWTESRDNMRAGRAHQCTAKADRCAWGRMQLRLATARTYCDNAATLRQVRTYGWNVECAAATLAALYRECGSWRCAVEAYYAGLNFEETDAVVAYAASVFAYAGVEQWP